MYVRIWMWVGGWVGVCARVFVLDSYLSILFSGICEIEGHISIICSNTIKCECGNLDVMYFSSFV